MSKAKINRRAIMQVSAAVVATAALPRVGAQPSRTPQKAPIAAPVVRISMGAYPAEKEREVMEMLDYRGKALGDAIPKLPGLIAYYSGVDREQKTMMNVSLWKDAPSANQMSLLQAMLDLGSVFTNLGVKFVRPIPNCETLWSVVKG